MAVSIGIEHVVKKYEDNVVIRDLSVQIEGGELFTLLGPSGCGKTTLLRMIAGFNSVEGGTISFDGRVVNRIPVHKRNFGMVFQNYAIFPNMTVYRNIEYGLKNKRLDKKEIADRVNRIMDVVRITPYKDRYPDKLSGGQQQRVALARAIVVRPQVLLMDEPLSNLDAKLRLEMREAIREIQKQIGITTVYVTHDQEEALAISDRIAVMNHGDILQIDTPENIYQRPRHTFVADFIGRSNHFEGEILSADGEGAAVRVAGADYTVRVPGAERARAGAKALVYVRPEEFEFARAGIPGTVRARLFLGKFITYRVETPGGSVAEVSVDAGETGRGPSVGDRVFLGLKEKRINLFDPSDNTTLMKGAGGHAV